MLACTVLTLAGCVSNELAWCTSDRLIINRFGLTRTRAIEVLRSADRLESSHTGAAGAPSCFVTAYRRIISRRDAPETFKILFEQASPIGKIYALAGLYDVDRATFERLINDARLSSPATFERIDGCIGTRVGQSDVFAELSAGQLSAWWRPSSSNGSKL